ncbi:MAG: hypothetical protein KAQ78_02570, partial [Candidatus Latescibacteria bacterium]|nr:hypothetical protein [Candidatus Latescibacterota bacterium]
AGIETLKTRLTDYDTGDWSMYDLIGIRAKEFYHQLHCRLLYELYFVTGDIFFLKYRSLISSTLD